MANFQQFVQDLVDEGVLADGDAARLVDENNNVVDEVAV